MPGFIETLPETEETGMITKAVIVVAPRPVNLLHTDTINPLVHLGGLTLIQRILYSLEWAGIEDGIVISQGDWPNLEHHLKEDPKLRSFSCLTSSATGEDAAAMARLDQILEGDLLLQLPGWIVDREFLWDLCQQESPLTKPVLVQRPEESLTGAGPGTPALVLVPGKDCPTLVKAIKEKAPPEELLQHLEEIPDREERVTIPESALIPAEKATDRLSAEQALFANLIKSSESFLCRKFNRRISQAITKRLLYSRITPHFISIVSVLIGLGGGLFFLAEHRLMHLTGALLFLLHSIVDGCDGELARLRFQESKIGSWLDFLGDNLVHVAVFFCIGLGLYLQCKGVVYLVLGSLSVLGTIGAAGQVFKEVILKSDAKVHSFHSLVAGDEGTDHPEADLEGKTAIADKFKSRDFIYLIIILAAAGQIWIWPWFNGPGACIFALYLLYVYRRADATRLCCVEEKG